MYSFIICEQDYKITDAWREANPTTIATTWCNNLKGARRVRTRIDKALIDDRLLPHTSNLDIITTKVSDHSAITWTLATAQKVKPQPYPKLPVVMLHNPEWLAEHDRIYEEERHKPDIIEGYEAYKKRIVVAAVKIRKRTKRQQTRDKTKLLADIAHMRKILRWAENAAAKVAKNKKIPRWERGNQLLREAKPQQWLGQALTEPLHVDIIEEKAADTSMHSLTKGMS